MSTQRRAFLAGLLAALALVVVPAVASAGPALTSCLPSGVYYSFPPGRDSVSVGWRCTEWAILAAAPGSGIASPLGEALSPGAGMPAPEEALA